MASSNVYSIYGQEKREALHKIATQSNPKLSDLTGGLFLAICVLDYDLSDLDLDLLPISEHPDKAASDAFKKRLPDGMELGWVYTGRALVFVIGSQGNENDSDEAAFTSQVINICEGFARSAEELLGVNISVSIGPCFSDIKKCEESVRNALIMAEFCRFVEFPAQVVDHDYYENLRTLIRKQYPDYKQENYERPLIAAILNRNFIHAELIFNNLLIAHLFDPLFVFPTLNTTLENVTRLCMALVAADPKKMSEENPQFADLQEMIRDCPNLRRMQKNIHLFFRMLSDYVQASYEAMAGNRKMQRIVDYVDEHFADPMLDAVALCDQFGISPSYLSRAFKEHTGINLLTYLQTLRITKAKRLLSKTEKTIEKIALEVGCVSGQNLLRLFKKLEGINPTIYRSLAKGDTPQNAGPSDTER